MSSQKLLVVVLRDKCLKSLESDFLYFQLYCRSHDSSKQSVY